LIHPDTTLAALGDPLGIALVATQPMPKGTVVWAQDELDRVLPAAQVERLPALFGQLRIRFAYRDTQGDYRLPWDDTRFMNHSCEPNCVVTAFGFEIAVRDIAAREPLTNDYASLHLEDDERIECACGAPRCRGSVTSRDFAPLSHEWYASVRDALSHAASVPQPLRPLLAAGAWDAALAYYDVMRRSDG